MQINNCDDKHNQFKSKYFILEHAIKIIEHDDAPLMSFISLVYRMELFQNQKEDCIQNMDVIF